MQHSKAASRVKLIALKLASFKSPLLNKEVWMAINSSPGTRSNENQSRKVGPSEQEEQLTKNQKWNPDQPYSNSNDDAEQNKGQDPVNPQIFGEGGAGKD